MSEDFEEVIAQLEDCSRCVINATVSYKRLKSWGVLTATLATWKYDQFITIY